MQAYFSDRDYWQSWLGSANKFTFYLLFDVPKNHNPRLVGTR